MPPPSTYQTPTAERVAHAAHEALRAWREEVGGRKLPPWERSPKHRRMATEVVRAALSGATVEDVHHVRVQMGVTAPWSEASDAQRKESALLDAVARSLGCGTERWDVKTLTDPAASQVDLTPKDATVADLVAIPAPPPDPPARLADEMVVYRVAGTITLAKEEADSDIHMVLADEEGNTMIVEAACPGCCSGSVALPQITAVRAAVQQQFPAAFQGQVMRNLSVPATVVGPLFFDRSHGQSGVAPNAAELHPVLDIEFATPTPGGTT